MTPILRFAEFTDDWEETTLENLAEVERGKFSVRPRNDPRYFGGEMPFVQTGDVTGSDVYLKGYSQTLNADGIKVSKVFPVDTILITIAANIGDTTITQYAVACPDSVVAIQAKKDLANTIFLKNLIDLQKENLDSQATQNAQKNINLQVLKPLQLIAPSKEEQTKIATFLSAVDEKISQLSQKLHLLGQYKQGMMQKLFSQQIRFNADDGSEFGEWESKTLGEIIKFVNGKGHENDVDSDGSYTLINSKFLSTNGNVAKKVNKCNQKVMNDSLVMVMSDVPNGKALAKVMYIQDGSNFALNQRIGMFIFYKDHYPKFFQYQLNRHQYYLAFDSGVGQTNLKKEDVLNCPILVPCIEEQTKIAKFLSAIDQKIDVVSEQLEQAKLWKKGLLQQMFV
ncbi:restriction endonuclease subunit S [Acinetobacter sp. YH12201]|uniref:restriction endonuclease subunit S n=1 Tax=Acinetobacter sp. YH12201 TaxID=2601140 RepID=UPI0015D21504|nr:restriction endonuclease subunit S [Acinetobacter sp. YH12201]